MPSNIEYLLSFKQLSEYTSIYTANLNTQILINNISYTPSTIPWEKVPKFGDLQGPYLQAYVETKDIIYLRLFEALFDDYFTKFTSIADKSAINIRQYVENSSNSIVSWYGWLYQVSQQTNLSSELSTGFIQRLVEFHIREIIPSCLLYIRYTVTNHRISGSTMLLQALLSINLSSGNDYSHLREVMEQSSDTMNNLNKFIFTLLDTAEFNQSLDFLNDIEDSLHQINQTIIDYHEGKYDNQLLISYIRLIKDEILRNYDIRMYADGTCIEYADLGHTTMDIVWVVKLLKMPQVFTSDEYIYLCRVYFLNALFYIKRYQPNGYGYRLLEDFRTHKSYLVNTINTFKDLPTMDEQSTAMLSEFITLVNRMFEDITIPLNLQPLINPDIPQCLDTWFPERGLACIRSTWSARYPGHVSPDPTKYIFAELEGGWNNIYQNYPGVVRGNVNLWTDNFPVVALPYPEIKNYQMTPWNRAIVKTSNRPAWYATGNHRMGKNVSIVVYELLYRKVSETIKVVRQIYLDSSGILLVEDIFPIPCEATYTINSYVNKNNTPYISSTSKTYERVVKVPYLYAYTQRLTTDREIKGITYTNSTKNDWRRITSIEMTNVSIKINLLVNNRVNLNFHSSSMPIILPTFTIKGKQMSGVVSLGTNNRVSILDGNKVRTTQWISDFSTESKILLYEYLNGRAYDYVDYTPPNEWISTTNNLLYEDEFVLSPSNKLVHIDWRSNLSNHWDYPVNIPKITPYIIDKQLYARYGQGSFADLRNVSWNLHDRIAPPSTEEYTMEFKWGIPVNHGKYTLHFPTEWCTPEFLTSYFLLIWVNKHIATQRPIGWSFIVEQAGIVQLKIRIVGYSTTKSIYERDFGLANRSPISFPQMRLESPDGQINPLW